MCHLSPPMRWSLGLALERYLHSDPEGSLIDAVTAGIGDFKRLHEGAAGYVIGGGRARRAVITRAGVMRCVAHVECLDTECEVPVLTQSDLLFETEIEVDQPRTAQRHHAAGTEARSPRGSGKCGRVVP